ncbi:hypothetical protein ABIE21_001063 [Conyzicola nivalis]|uniref:MobA/VirD2-like nuclease domain-containing protein n=1 Tax=Conyzicola nivalis TaxID=1477021 RepID=A0ABV2QKJ4_9MICO
MSITDVKADYDIRASAEYLVLGVGTKRKGHLASGTNRLVPGFYCDAPGINEFVALGNDLAKQHGRKVKAQSYVLSFSPDEFDASKPADLQRVGDAGFLLAKKMHPNSPCLVVVHADGKGRAAHAHIKVLNHDNATGKALRAYRVHWQVKRANDELMRDLGMNVLQAKPKPPADSWVSRRPDLPQFERSLGDICAEAKDAALASIRATPTPTMDVFTAQFGLACRARGVELVVDEFKVKSDKRRGSRLDDVSKGFTFKMRDEYSPKRRMRRRKASALSSEFTYDKLAATLAERESSPRQTSFAPIAPVHKPRVLRLVDPSPSLNKFEPKTSTLQRDDHPAAVRDSHANPILARDEAPHAPRLTKDADSAILLTHTRSQEVGTIGSFETPRPVNDIADRLVSVNERNRRLGVPLVSREHVEAREATSPALRKRKLEHPELFGDSLSTGKLHEAQDGLAD